jgi:hypothetical protein
LNVPILAMSHSFLGSGRTIAASMRIGGQRGLAVQPQARSEAKDRTVRLSCFARNGGTPGARKSNGAVAPSRVSEAAR